MLWNTKCTSVGANWGKTPSPVEPLAATYTFHLRDGVTYRVYPLDAQGNRTKQVAEGTGQFTATLDTGADATV